MFSVSIVELRAYDDPVSRWQYVQLLSMYQISGSLKEDRRCLLASMRAYRTFGKSIAELAAGAAPFCKIGHPRALEIDVIL
jgi:hypothetical protein